MENTNKKPKTFAVPGNTVSVFCYEWFEMIAQCFVIVVFVMSFFFRLFTVDGTSMENTFKHRDKVIVQKSNYTPSNGDVVVIKPYRDLTEPIIKRVIATEDQEFSIDSNLNVRVNNVLIPETYIKEKMHDLVTGSEPTDILPKVPHGYSFVMGDNRNYSLDSRYAEVGYVDNKYIVGRVRYIYFPFFRIRSIVTPNFWG
ncbi:MAG: signal peptidase I [Candidatus Improbicoccus devescovinae]|nr:MAG: signal peptidase I [Candidatus Improbicoccus devescovinae]